MQYLMLLSNAPDTWDSPEAPQREDWGAYTQALVEAGIMVSGAGLQGIETATTVQVRSGERLLTDGPFADTKEHLIGFYVIDGPFADTKEHLIGFYVIDVPDLDTALEWAAKVPNVRTGSVEVRPVMPDAEAARADVTASAAAG